jgi:hypothetical protein
VVDWRGLEGRTVMQVEINGAGTKSTDVDKKHDREHLNNVPVLQMGRC